MLTKGIDFVLFNLRLNLSCGYILLVNRTETEMNHLSPEMVILTFLLATLAYVLWLEQPPLDLPSNTWYLTLKVRKYCVIQMGFSLEKRKDYVYSYLF